MRCPICKALLTPETMTHRPFCSPRCKSIDLAKWLTEDYRIPVESEDDDEGSSDGNVPTKPDEDT